MWMYFFLGAYLEDHFKPFRGNVAYNNLYKELMESKISFHLYDFQICSTDMFPLLAFCGGPCASTSSERCFWYGSSTTPGVGKRAGHYTNAFKGIHKGFS